MDIEKFTRKNKRSAERNDSGRGRANRRAIYQPAIRRSGPKRSDNRKITIEELSGNAEDAFLAYQAYLETKSETPRIELGWDPNLSEFEQKVGRATLEGLQRVREDREIRDDNSEPNPESLRSSRGKARFIYAPTPGFHVEPESVVYTIPTSPSKKKKNPRISAFACSNAGCATIGTLNHLERKVRVVFAEDAEKFCAKGVG